MAATFSNLSLQFLVILLSLNSLIDISLGGRQIDPKSSTQFIKTSCSSTRYPDLCCATLLSQASTIQTSPRLMVHAALNVALGNAKSTTASVVKLSKTHGLQPKETNAMQDCLEVLSDTEEELRKSISEMDKIESANAGLTVNDIQTWVSAALTDETTCSDVFEVEHISGGAKTSVRSQLLTVAHLTSNALALVNDYASNLA
ncbi:pectin methyl-esterase inhibitor 13 [Hibiscus trionum]|uniref:pectinesterase n=1 Tax=Hibiscus trionum TaxID=183268 RepID=A0A9W7MUE6_HIBTR|nr:pectin methyl-esterase inhibitor 13 [Hibiscus trionum]GMJ13645.1 pectin methyl-esterase inhibitor 13 [Hibiscus trionum]GMJ13646.1 pectin methyl-esterase inhibitor 13 [Hibiscus trionum]GMJ13647.1 pectin methyl-esterase inhibitor 13 [Hibiscus trionum]GMJ13648.1 pectin methyl-esterase inhibitor 13 [Hibiscus trionum]